MIFDIQFPQFKNRGYHALLGRAQVFHTLQAPSHVHYWHNGIRNITYGLVDKYCARSRWNATTSKTAGNGTQNIPSTKSSAIMPVSASWPRPLHGLILIATATVLEARDGSLVLEAVCHAVAMVNIIGRIADSGQDVSSGRGFQRHSRRLNRRQCICPNPHSDALCRWMRICSPRKTQSCCWRNQVPPESANTPEDLDDKKTTKGSQDEGVKSVTYCGSHFVVLCANLNLRIAS
jgi:hypothetical protein